MVLRGIDFGPVLGASGVQGFFGEGYAFHKPLEWLGLLDFSRMTFVSKTATLFPRIGNMPLKTDWTPKHLLPNCIKVQHLKGLMLNAVGLSNPGLAALLAAGRWQRRTSPYIISIMSLADTKEERLQELSSLTGMLNLVRDQLGQFGLQLNLSCPNTGHDPSELMEESHEALQITSKLKVPFIPKYSIASAPIEALLKLDADPNCDAICISNSVPYGWQGIGERTWGAKQSPLHRIGGGGLSGKILRPLVCDYIRKLRERGFRKPINGGGGILCPADVDHYHVAGASSIFLGSIAALRPWQVQPTIKHAASLHWSNEQ